MMTDKDKDCHDSIAIDMKVIRSEQEEADVNERSGRSYAIEVTLDRHWIRKLFPPSHEE